MPARQERESESDRDIHTVRNHRATVRALGKRLTRVRETQIGRERGIDREVQLVTPCLFSPPSFCFTI